MAWVVKRPADSEPVVLVGHVKHDVAALGPGVFNYPGDADISVRVAQREWIIAITTQNGQRATVEDGPSKGH